MGVAEDLAVQVHAHPIGLDLSVQLEHRMPRFHFEMVNKAFVGLDGKNALFTTFHFQLVVYPKDVEKGLILEVSGCESWEIDVRKHRDVKKYGAVVDKAQSFKINAACITFRIRNLETESLFPGADLRFYHDFGDQFFTDGRSGAGQGEDTDPFWLAGYDAALALLLLYEAVHDKPVKGLSDSWSGQFVKCTEFVFGGQEVPRNIGADFDLVPQCFVQHSVMGHSIGFRQHGFRRVCCAKVFNFCLKKLLLRRINRMTMKHVLLLSFFLTFSLAFQARDYRFLVGTYTNTGKSQGIYCYNLNKKSGVATQKSVTTGVSNPSFLCITPDKKFVYTVNESSEASAANAFSLDAASGKLTMLNQSLTNGKGPCYIASTRKHVFTANYGGGSLSVFGRNADGSLSELMQKIQHVGSSFNLDRQAEPHVHQVIVSKNNDFILANDLGTDKIFVYRYKPNAVDQILIPWDTLAVKLGSGPRHVAFSRNGKKAYLVQELDGTVSVLEFKGGRLKLLQEASLLNDQGRKAWAADIRVSPDGKFVYATNRAPANNITCFKVLKDGTLTFQSQVSTGGDGPRNFALTPDGNFVLVAHQFSNNIVLFERNKKTGALTDTGKRIDVGAPVCLVFF